MLGLVASCETSAEPPVLRPPPPANEGLYAFADGCYALDATDPGSDDTRWLAATESGAAFRFTARTAETGARFFLKASDLGTYLFYDAEGRRLKMAEAA